MRQTAGQTSYRRVITELSRLLSPTFASHCVRTRAFHHMCWMLVLGVGVVCWARAFGSWCCAVLMSCAALCPGVGLPGCVPASPVMSGVRAMRRTLGLITIA